MELDEIEKRLEWLDSERKKTNQQIKEYKNRITELEGKIDAQQQQLAVLQNDVKTSVNVSSRLAQFDETIAQTKSDMLKSLTESEKKHASQLKAFEKQQKSELSQFTGKFSEIQTFAPSIVELKKSLQNRIDDENWLMSRIDTVESQYDSIGKTVNEFIQNIKKNSDEIQSEYKRASDIQIEMTALRKRIDEERNRGDLNYESVRKVEGRIASLEAVEIERKQDQTAFIEKMSLAQLERDNLWKSWQERFTELTDLSDVIRVKMDSLDKASIALKKSQTELDDINSRFDRRINELTEMHRLTEDRFRQEWISFKNEDQKRWTNYSLTQDEKNQDDVRQMSKFSERIVALEDAAQESKDTIELINEETDKRMKAFTSVLHDLMESFNQTFNIR
jgi:chromosome segregation ATPase